MKIRNALRNTTVHSRLKQMHQTNLQLNVYTGEEYDLSVNLNRVSEIGEKWMKTLEDELQEKINKQKKH